NRKALHDIGSVFTPPVKSNTQRRKSMITAEIQLQSMWAVALGVEMDQISANDSFLQIDNSIEAMRLVGPAREQGIVLAVAQVFENPIQSDMATVIQTTTDGRGGQVDPFTLLDESVDVQLVRQQVTSQCSV